MVQPCSMQLEQERRKSNGLAQALQREKEQHFIVQQQVCGLVASLWRPCLVASSYHWPGSASLWRC